MITNRRYLEYNFTMLDDDYEPSNIQAAEKAQEAREFYHECNGEKPCNIRLKNVRLGTKK